MENGNDGTGRGLVDFLDYLAAKGLANKSTMQSRKSAVAKVLGIDDDWESVDLRKIDLDQQADRFERLMAASGRYTPGSLATYSSRFKSAVADYLTYLDDPARFKPSAGTVRSRNRTADANDDRPRQVSHEMNTSDGTPPPRRDNLITYPYPLRDNQDTYLQLPRDLTSSEADRLARFIASLAVEPTAER